MDKNSFKSLIAWQKAMTLTTRVYELSAQFPRAERFGLVSQIRRSAVSVPSNIAEGHGRFTRGEWQQFLGHARGSLLELHTQLLLAERLGMTEAPALARTIELCEEVGRILNGLIRSSFYRFPRKPSPSSS
jgi:four helix bundle protein